MTTRESDSEKNGNKLVILWTSQDREVAQNMVFMYALNSKLHNWWNQVKLIVWGPSSKLLSIDKELQYELKKLKKAGVELQACKACADGYGTSDKLKDLGFEVIYMGVPLTGYIKEGYSVITF